MDAIAALGSHPDWWSGWVGALISFGWPKCTCRCYSLKAVSAPAYRLPLSTFERALPKLIGEKKLSANEISLLVEYMSCAEELNRGLDRAAKLPRLPRVCCRSSSCPPGERYADG
jgi:hypothetical protein